MNKIRDDYEKGQKKKYDEFAERVKGHICRWHMYWSNWEREWRQHYEPLECARHCLKAGEICELIHCPVSKMKANIFYDRKITKTRRSGTLFDSEEMTGIEKGIRFFETAKSITICEEVLKRCKDAIIRRERQL